jgi:hypothetical protein
MAQRMVRVFMVIFLNFSTLNFAGDALTPALSRRREREMEASLLG